MVDEYGPGPLVIDVPKGTITALQKDGRVVRPRNNFFVPFSEYIADYILDKISREKSASNTIDQGILGCAVIMQADMGQPITVEKTAELTGLPIEVISRYFKNYISKNLFQDRIDPNDRRRRLYEYTPERLANNMALEDRCIDILKRGYGDEVVDELAQRWVAHGGSLVEGRHSWTYPIKHAILLILRSVKQEPEKQTLDTFCFSWYFGVCVSLNWRCTADMLVTRTQDVMPPDNARRVYRKLRDAGDYLEVTSGDRKTPYLVTPESRAVRSREWSRIAIDPVTEGWGFEAFQLFADRWEKIGAKVWSWDGKLVGEQSIDA